MPSTTPEKCANCGTTATHRCSGCLGAPEYQPGDNTVVSYCGRDCQKNHWPSHKSRCNTMRQRRKLLRAALALKTTLLTYREMFYDIPLTRIELRAGTLYLHQRQQAITAPCIRGPFPDHLTINAEHKEAALAINQCTTAMALLGRLTRKLLAGIASTIEVLDLHIGRQPVPVKLVPGPDASICPHTVIKVGQLSAKERWILDTTGCQYGSREVLIPFDKYIEIRECRNMREPVAYDATETKDLDYFATLPFMNNTRAQRENMQQERQSRLQFAKFVDLNVSRDLLDGTDAGFKENLDGLVSELKSHMLKPARRSR
ncbi:hypothetical protein BJX76DRAFT_368323 [Aspergillus varians]